MPPALALSARPRPSRWAVNPTATTGTLPHPVAHAFHTHTCLRHCEGPATTSNAAGGSETGSTNLPQSTGAAPRFEVAGLGFAGIAVVAAMAL
jgi:hypothetical protein